MVNFGPLLAISSGVWGTPANFNGFRVLASLLQRRHSLEANQTTFGRFLAGTVYNTYILGGSFPGGISPHAKFTLRPSLAFSYIGSATARHSSSGVSQTLRHGTRNGIPNFRRGRHLYSAGRPSRWASGPHSSYKLFSQL